MASPIEDAEAAIRELARMHLAGEISEDEFRRRSVLHAAVIANHREAEQALASRLMGSLAVAVDYAERNPAVVHAAVAGLIHGLGHYLRSTEAGE